MNLVIAASLGKFDFIKESLNQPDADVNATDEYGDTALHAACVAGRFDIAMHLVSKGADLNIQNKV